MSFNTRIRPVAVIPLDLGNARADLAQGTISLKGVNVSTWLVNYITVLTLGGGSLSFKFNSTNNDAIPASDGLDIGGIPINEIYWTNAAQAGKTAKVLVAWVD